jgi:hypothetical protein
LDAFWSRLSATVTANRDKMKQALNLSELVGLTGPYERFGTMPTKDTFGCQVAIQTVLASRRPGKYSADHTQYNTIRKIRTVYSNHARASPQANQNPLMLGDDKGKTQRFVQDSCSSYWYSRFSIGLKHRMGQDWRPNMAFSTDLICVYLQEIEAKISEAVSFTELNHWITIGTYSVITYLV